MAAADVPPAPAGAAAAAAAPAAPAVPTVPLSVLVRRAVHKVYADLQQLADL